jgi:hypothetical protein
MLKVMQGVFFIVVALCAYVPASRAVPPRGVYVYQDTETKRKLTYDTAKMTFTDGHLIVSMHACPRKYRCLRGGPINFVLPANWLSAREWTMRTDHFRVTEAREVSFFGHAEPVSVIEGTLSDANVEYFFSSTRGLIGIKVSSPSVHSTLLSASLCGFAADNCKP